MSSRNNQIAGRVEPDAEARPFQVMTNEAGNIRVVFHYIDCRLHANHCSWEVFQFDTRSAG